MQATLRSARPVGVSPGKRRNLRLAAGVSRRVAERVRILQCRCQLSLFADTRGPASALRRRPPRGRHGNGDVLHSADQNHPSELCEVQAESESFAKIFRAIGS